MADWRNSRYAGGPAEAAPEGLQQQVQAVETDPNGGGSWTESRYGQEAMRLPRWQTGGQYGSTENGWNTPFTQKMFDQRALAEKEGTLGSIYDREDFTGIATYQGTRDGRDVKLGDVYEDGVFKGNVLSSSSGFDPATGYQWLAALTLSADEQAHVNKRLQTDPNALKNAVEDRAAETTKEVTGWRSQQEYAQNVQDQKDEWDDGSEAVATIGATALGGAGLGAALGSVVPVVGTAVGAVAGGILGAFGGALNKDQIVDQAARATVQGEMADEFFGAGTPAALGNRLANWGGLGLSAISPLTNLVQGATDAANGGWDDESAYYEMGSERPWWLTGLGLTATLGDSLLQFASPLGRAAFLGATGGVVAGQATQLGTGGATFDDRIGAFDRPDDLGQWAAAIGAVGIDAVQMLGARGIGRAAASADDVALDAADAVKRGGLFNRTLPEGAVRTERVGGREFYLDKAGQVVGSPRTTLTVLAPSEATMWASARLQTQILRAQRSGAVTPGEANQLLYQAAKDLEGGTNLAKTALVNAFGEGSEEAVQAVLEPLSHGWTPDANDVIMSYLSGAAAGAGMSVGARVGTASSATRSFNRVNQLRAQQQLPKFTREEWNAMSPEEQAQHRALPGLFTEGLREAGERAARGQVMEGVRSQAGLQRSMDALLQTQDQELRAANPALEGTFTIGALQSPDVPNHVVLSDLTAVRALLTANNDRLIAQLAEQAPGTDPVREAVRDAGTQILAFINPRAQEFQTADPSRQAELVREVNEALELAWSDISYDENGSLVAGPAAKAVSVLLSRSPNNSPGSFQMLLPQVSLQDTLDGGRGLLKVSHAILKMIDGDFDGDMARQHVNVELEVNDDAYRSLRLGLNALGMSDGGVKIGTRATEAQAILHVGISVATGGPAASAGRAAGRVLGAWLRANFATVPGIDSIADTAVQEFTSGNADAKQNLYKQLVLKGQDEVIAIGERGNGAQIPPGSSPWFAIDQAYNRIAVQFNESMARRIEVDRNFDEVAPVRKSSEAQTREARSAGTPGAWMHQATPGNDAFRAPQHLHYGDERSPAETAGQRPENELDTLTAWYERMSSGIGTSVLENLLAKTPIHQRALQILDSVARMYELEGNGLVGSSTVAALSMPNYRREGDSWVDEGGTISLGQWALREAADSFAHREDLIDKAGFLRSLDAHEAWAEIFDAAPLVAVMGEAANNFGPQLTVGQLKGNILQKDAIRRRDMREAARQDVRYVLKRHDLPYSRDEILEAGSINAAYQVAVDAIFAAADLELSSDPKTGIVNPNSRMAVRDREMQATFESAIQYIRKAIQSQSLLHRVKKVDAQAIYTILDQNPQVAQSLMSLFPTEIVPALFAPQADGTILIRSWVAEMLTQDPKQAAMTYFRGTLLAQLMVLGEEKNPRAADDRMVDLVLKLQAPGNEAQLARFQELLLTSTDLTEFLATLNKEFRYGAPQLGWYRDVAQFDPSRTQGGWSKQLPGAELRDAVRGFHDNASAFNDYAAQELELDRTDADIMSRVDHALQQIAAGRRADDESLLATLQQAFKTAAGLRPALGPSTLLRSVYGAASGFMGNMTDKGKGATFYETLANIQALGSSPLQSIGYLQMLGALTSWDADDAAANPSLLAGANLRLTDRAGKVVEWTGLTQTEGDKYDDVRRFVEMWRDPAYRPMLRAVVFPTAFEATEYGGLSQQMLTKTSLHDLLGDPNDGTVYDRMLGSNQKSDVLRYAAQIDALTSKFGQNFGLQRMAADLAVARTSTASRLLSGEELEEIANEAMLDVSRLVRAASSYGDQERVEQLVKEAIKRLTRSTQIDDTLPPEVQAAIKDDLFGTIVEGLNPDAGPEQLDVINQLVYGNADLFRDYVQAYLIDWTAPTAALERQQQLTEIIRSTPSIAETTLEQAVRELRTATMTDATGTVAVLSADPAENQAKWDAIGRAVLSYKFTSAVTGVASAKVPVSVIPKTATYDSLLDRATNELRRENLGLSKYMDQSFRYLLDPIAQTDSPVLKAGREFALLTRGEGAAFESVSEQDVEDAINRVLDPDKLGRWTPEIMRQSVDASNRIDSSGASRQVSSAGILYSKYAALIKATRPTFLDPETAGVKPRTYFLSDKAAAGLVTGKWDELDMTALEAPDGSTEPLALLQGRFLAREPEAVTVSYRDRSGNLIETNLRGSASISPDHEYQKYAAGRAVGLAATSLAELSTSLGSILPADATELSVSVSFYHPQDRPAGADWATNLFFNGETDLADLIMGIDGLNVTEQVASLKANKKGTDALINPSLPSLADVAMLEAAGDMYGVLTAKTMHLLGRTLGHSLLPTRFYAAVFTDLKMRHGFKVTDDSGLETLLSADEAIALQREGKFPSGQVQLITLSQRTLNSLLSEQGNQGLARPALSVPTIDSAGVSDWEGSLAALAGKVPGLGQTGSARDLLETRMGARGSMSQSSVRPPMTQTERDQAKRRLIAWNDYRTGPDARREGNEKYRRRIKIGMDLLLQDSKTLSQVPQYALRQAGFAMNIPLDANPDSHDIAVQTAFGELNATMRGLGTSTVWQFSHSTSGLPGTRADGVLHGYQQIQDEPGEKDHAASGDRILHRDLVIVHLDTFPTDPLERKAELLRVMRLLADRGASIALVDSTGNPDGRLVPPSELDAMMYRSVPGARGVFVPFDPSSRFRTLEALYSRLTQTEEIVPDSYALLFHSPELAVNEAAALANKLAQKNGREIVLTNSLAPTTAYGEFGVAATEAQRRLVSDALAAYASDERSIDFLLGLGESVEPASTKKNPKQERKDADARAELAAALQRAADNYDVATGLPAVGSDFGPGDIIALVGPGNKIILTRHGYTPIRDLNQLAAQLATPISEGKMGANVAIYGTRNLELATTYSGKIREWVPLGNVGLSVRQAVPISELSNKEVVQEAGAKLIISGDLAESPHEVPTFGPLQRWNLDYFTHWDDTQSKENYPGMIVTARDAAAFIGADFTPAYAESLLGISRVEWNAMTEKEQIATRKRLTDVFKSLEGRGELNVSTVESIRKQIFHPDDALTGLKATLAGELNAPFLNKEVSQLTAADQVTLGALIYMQWNGAKANDVMGAPGFDAPRIGQKPVTFRPPALFTALFDDAPMGSTLRGWFFDELNSRLNNRPGEKGRSGYHLAQDWTFTILNENPRKNLAGYLQFAELHTSGHAPEIKEQSRDRNRKEDISRQQTLVIEESLNATLYRSRDLPKTARFIAREGMNDAPTGMDVLGLLNNERLRKVPTYSLTQTPSAAERGAFEANRDARIAFEKEFTHWTAEEQAEIDVLRNDVVLEMGLTEEYAGRVDTWVRAWLGRPAPSVGQDPTIDNISLADYRDAVQQGIRVALDAGRYPLDGAPMSQLGLADVLALARAAQQPGVKWKLRGADGQAARSVEDFVLVALNPDRSAPEGLFQTAADGFFNTFRDYSEEFAALPVSMDPSRVMSINAANFVGPGARLTDILGGTVSSGTWVGEYPKSSSLAAAQRRFANYRKKHGVPEMVPMTMEELRSGGARFVTAGTASNALMRIMLNMRAANGMLNPWLFVTAPVESGIKNVLEVTKDFLTGEGSGALSQAMNRLTGGSPYGEALMKQGELVDSALGNHQGFKGMINQDILVHAKLSNAGRVERWTAKLAAVAGRWQDPSYGMKQEMLAKRYRSSVMSNALVMGSRLNLTPAQLLAGLQTDPEYVRKNHPELHQYAINRIANLRSLKPTVLSLLLMKGFIDPLTHNPRILVNMPATLFGKLPLMFFNYAANAATNILGLQALNATSAMIMNSPALKRMVGKGRAWAAGEGREYNPDKHDIDFVAETMEHVNLADAVIQSGLTHTGLMGLGLLAGSLGLNGEDDEDKRRRKAAQLQGAGWVYDPREIVNDWRNADALYLDNLPDWFPFADAIQQMYKVGVDQQGNPVSMVQLHWTLKQFISPMMGIENYINTGNFAHVLWGFEDALGSMPLVNETQWDQAARVAVELENAARDAESRGNPVDLVNSFAFLTNGVMSLERMLFENSFVNSIYAAVDEYDRDPYKLADLNNTGEIQRDDTGQPQGTQGLQEYMGDNGELGLGGLQPSPTEARLKTLTENRASLALFTSLFTGLADSEYIRYNMAVKERNIERAELTDEEATSLVMSMWDPNGNREVLTEEGGMAIVHGLRMGSVKPGDPALDNVFLTFEQRQAIQARIESELLQEFLDLGMGKEEADEQLRQTMFGSETNPYAVPLWEVIWSKGAFEGAIGYDPTITYRQLNTTYVAGPDGKMWATGVARSSLENFFGQAPLQTYNSGQLGGNLEEDARLNSTDPMSNLNTGMRNLERVSEEVMNPTDEDILRAVEEGFQRTIDAITQPSWTDFGGQRYGRSGFSRGGGGGGGYSYRLNSPVRNDATYGRNIPFVNPDNPIIRRATIRRERFSSERGRLNQWQ